MANIQSKSRRTALVTGAAGFIGAALSRRLLDAGWRVLGLDSLNDYYDPGLKHRRLALLRESEYFHFIEGKVETPDLLNDLFATQKPDAVIHLAAQAGVRYSIENPESYVDANLIGGFRVIEASRHHKPEHLLFASTSSVYGANTAMPYTETDQTETQMSFYAATKKAGEAMAHSYAHLYGIPTTMFRFFTVYGPWGRPDMAPMLFADAILNDRPINVFNHGEMMRDFTYIDDLTTAIERLIDCIPLMPDDRTDQTINGDSISPVAPYRIVNIGNANPVALGDFIAAMESALGKKARKNFLDMQPGDVKATWAQTGLLHKLTSYLPKTSIETGTQNFADWYKHVYLSDG